jgi:UDP-glucose 4-epimerase
MRSLITGGAGFIGSHVAKYCRDMGHEVTVLDDLSGGFKENIPKEVRFVKGSITDYNLLQYLFKKGKFDYVYHLAAYAAEGLSHFIRRFNYENNLTGSINLINESIKYGVDCFVFTSSIAVYGSNQLPMTEDLTPIPEDPYGIAKYAVEMDLEAAHEMFGLNYVIFRPHNVYGPNQNTGDRYRNVIGIFIKQIMDGEPMTIFGDGEQTRAFSYINDVAPYISRSVAVEGALNQTFNIGADEVSSVNSLAEMVAEAMGVEPKIKYLKKRNEVLHAHSDHSKAKKVFDIGETVELKDGIEEMAMWTEHTGIRKTDSFRNVEITKNMPPSWKEHLRK